MSAELAKDMTAPVSVRDLMQKLKTATERMSVTNSHRDLLFQAAAVIHELDRRVRERDRQLERLTKAANEVLELEDQRRVVLAAP